MRRPSRNPNGRPSSISPEKRQAIIDAISKRVPYDLAAESNGITERLLYYWLTYGERDLDAGNDTEYAKFFQSIKKVESEKIQKHLEVIENKPERWQADAWILERRWWKHFSPNAAVIDFEKRLKRMEEEEKGESQNDKANGIETK